MPDEVLGAELDYNLLEKLKKWEIDVCKAKEEFHTVVYASLSFRENKFSLKQEKNIL
jgi:diphthamide synthase (EF-2-diphthine--ammonia ligase)